MFSVSDVQRIQKVVSASNIEQDALDILTVVRPLWKTALAEHGREIFTFRVLSGGLTNKLFACSCRQYPDDAVVIKVYGSGTDLLIDRNAEIEYINLLGKHKCGPELFAIFDNGTCFEFLHGSTLNTSTCRSPEIYPLVAGVLGRLHKIPYQSDSNATSKMWGKLRHFVGLLEKDVFITNVPLKNKLAEDFGFVLGKIKESIAELEKILERQHIPVALCHNDLLLGNVMYDDSSKKVTLIDFEYTMPNYIAYDVANHFVEFVGLEHPNFDKCPNASFRRAWIQQYLKVFIKGRKCEINFSQEDFERWVYLCIPAAHLFWSVWAAVQADKSEIEFDYVGYAGTRYAEFERCMGYIRGEHIYKRLLKSLR